MKVSVGRHVVRTSTTVLALPLYTVQVHEPWPMPYLFVPQTSAVLINCTANFPVWSIDLVNDSSTVQDQFNSRSAKLNAHGLYELPQIETPGMPPTLRLLINDTARNNQTDIYCSNDGNTFTTTLGHSK